MTAFRILSRFLGCARGATAVEYAFIALIIASVLVATLPAVTPELASIFEEATEGLESRATRDAPE